ncbi:hypothetical protein N7509_002057 [Penicillium cosmopolitanum]|uniref:Uncharacterized protein n=1 Tax=Penicillium cosmopolitanum TaxID=1131564 RepID=A0A9W9W8C1_9EURO|nr:uncharacterized protein N7509_002057 [Penicillium cosmopolitanum]KAJ5408174.1 hypothetical protein N7509_002057 [Penicillium cosmopolitanum]
MMNHKEEYRLSYVPLEDERHNYRQSRQRPLSSAEQVLLQSNTKGFWGSSWTFEIIGSIISIAFLVGIIVVLFKYDGQPMPDWPYGITLNALISVLSTVMKASMAFVLTECLAQLKWSWFHSGNKLSDLALLDAASRGVAGAFFVLFRFLPRHLVTFGCLVLVMAAATDPFVQQVMAVKERSVHAPGQASIQVCNSSLYTDYGEGPSPGMNKVLLGTSGAIYSGIFQTQTPNSKSIMMECPTGNCTFPTYQSLGFCSKCANITDSLKTSPSSNSMTGETKFKLPNGFEFTTSLNMPYLINSTALRPLVKLDTEGMATIVNFTAIAGQGYGGSISATECALYFCVNTYEASVRQGKFVETTTAISTTSNASSNPMDSLIDVTLTPEICYSNGTRHEKPYKKGSNCTFAVNAFSKLAMANSLKPLLKGKASRFMSNRPDYSSDTIEALYGMQGNYTDINSVFQSLASSLTVNARSKVCAAPVNGTAWTDQSYVRVRWEWLILPGGLVALSLVFMIITIIHTRNQYIWKSSPLALLFSDLQVDAASTLKPDPTLKGMETTSRNMQVWLETTADGVRLKAVQD